MSLCVILQQGENKQNLHVLGTIYSTDTIFKSLSGGVVAVTL